MTDDIPASDNLRLGNDAPSQKMTIYMPQGAVIIERTELDIPGESMPNAPLTEIPKPPKSGTDSVQSAGAVINIYSGSDECHDKESTNSKATSSDSPKLIQQEILIHISEILDVISQRLTQNPVITTETKLIGKAMSEEVQEMGPALSRNVVIKENSPIKTHRLDWMHAFNLTYISIILTLMLIPMGLHTFLQLNVISASTNYPAVGIQSGDLLVTKGLAAQSIAVGDVISLHNTFSNASKISQVSQITTPNSAGLISITLPPLADQRFDLTYSVKADTEVYKVIKSIPILGSIQKLNGSFYLEILVGASVLLLNTIVHFRRRRNGKSRHK